MDETMNIDNIPEEIVVQICEGLSTAELSKFIRTNSKYYRICNDIYDRKRYEEIFANNPKFTNNFRIAEKNGTNVRVVPLTPLLGISSITLDLNTDVSQIITDWDNNRIRKGTSYYYDTLIIPEFRLIGKRSDLIKYLTSIGVNHNDARYILFDPITINNYTDNENMAALGNMHIPPANRYINYAKEDLYQDPL